MITMQDALDNTAADDEVIQLQLSDVRAWREAERKLLVGMINDRIQISKTKALLDAAQMEITQLQEQHTTTSRRMQYLEAALRNAIDEAAAP